MKRKYLTSVCASLLFSAALVASPGYVQDQNAAPDNTKVNKQDREQAQPTADQGKNNTSDRDIAAHIRRDVVKDKSLSSYGHNVKIVADHGKVTLKGPVHSDEEKRAIEDHARKYVGDGNIDSQMTVKSDK
jgi:osmotically-inducible protein OsmY